VPRKRRIRLAISTVLPSDIRGLSRGSFDCPPLEGHRFGRARSTRPSFFGWHAVYRDTREKLRVRLWRPLECANVLTVP
jgi:hypothetical protein